ncbi:E3 ubiquitin-protein ligase RNF152 isoform X5 [Mauremys reevesii]|uniref:E3 ubiquitin-protein ligase RNF152 isoform X5 n=1 Tax=Mauremys reevesii TaxID=260615 RepID=UPI00193FC45E|nr:E3 ubiquitin-protein ligase RNF152 isoform X5 [Mauremys reevesii]
MSTILVKVGWRVQRRLVDTALGCLLIWKDLVKPQWMLPEVIDRENKPRSLMIKPITSYPQKHRRMSLISISTIILETSIPTSLTTALCPDIDGDSSSVPHVGTREEPRFEMEFRWVSMERQALVLGQEIEQETEGPHQNIP